MNKEEKLQETIKVFEALKLEYWSHKNISVGGGGQATGLVVYGSKGEKGVFRLAHCNSQEAKDRFKRELNILTSPTFKHNNIIEILDYTKSPENEFWYISQLGESLHTYWSNYTQQEKDLDKKVTKAIDIILGLLDGLQVCHSHNPMIIHRDIKSKNVVLINNIPKLIDFGIAYDDGGEDISPVDKAAANRKSHDMQLYRGAEKIPWYDVYLMAQLLIWMVCENPLTTWERPLNWRFVVFPIGISKSNVIKLKSIFALCSTPELAPKDASELIILIGNVFKEQIPTNITMKSKFDINKIKEIMVNVEAGMNTAKVHDFELFEALFPFFSHQFIDIWEKVEKSIAPLEELDVKIAEMNTLEDWALASRESINGDSDLVNFTIFQVLLGNKGRLIFDAYFFPTEYLKKNSPNIVINEESRRLLCNIHFTGEFRGSARKGFSRIVAFSSDKQHSVLSGSFHFTGTTTTEILLNDITEFLGDPELWELLKI